MPFARNPTSNRMSNRTCRRPRINQRFQPQMQRGSNLRKEDVEDEEEKELVGD
jgi:hypothetical protein